MRNSWWFCRYKHLLDLKQVLAILEKAESCLPDLPTQGIYPRLKGTREELQRLLSPFEKQWDILPVVKLVRSQIAKLKEFGCTIKSVSESQRNSLHWEFPKICWSLGTVTDRSHRFSTAILQSSGQVQMEQPRAPPRFEKLATTVHRQGIRKIGNEKKEWRTRRCAQLMEIFSDLVDDAPNGRHELRNQHTPRHVRFHPYPSVIPPSTSSQQNPNYLLQVCLEQLRESWSNWRPTMLDWKQGCQQN